MEEDNVIRHPATYDPYIYKLVYEACIFKADGLVAKEFSLHKASVRYMCKIYKKAFEAHAKNS